MRRVSRQPTTVPECIKLISSIHHKAHFSVNANELVWLTNIKDEILIRHSPHSIEIKYAKRIVPKMKLNHTPQNFHFSNLKSTSE